LKARTPSPAVVNLEGPAGIAFDGAHGRWVSWNGDVLVRFTADDRGGTGEEFLAPALQVTTTVSSLAKGLAFDEGGGLWIAYSAGKIARLSPSQIASSGKVTPETILTSSAIGSAKELAFDPAPAGLPIHASRP
jgi:sugar lactone lactonase YvrE